MNKIFKRYLITALVGLVFAGAVFAFEIQYYDIKKDILIIISNSAFVSGALICLAGLFCLISNGGGFDAFAYLGYRIKKQFKKKKNGPDGYFEFVTESQEKEKIPMGNLFIIGGILVIVSFVTAMLR